MKNIISFINEKLKVGKNQIHQFSIKNLLTLMMQQKHFLNILRKNLYKLLGYEKYLFVKVSRKKYTLIMQYVLK